MAEVSPLTPEILHVANAVLEWSENFLAAEHPEMERPTGESRVCPFIKPSIDSNFYYMVFHPEVNGRDISHIIEIMTYYLSAFKTMPPRGGNARFKKALLSVFPFIENDRFDTLDLAFESVKDHFVRQGLMVAQFHPRCDDRSVHNPMFCTSKAPCPLMAVRHMAFHDILFLYDPENPNSDWFDVYNRFFGVRFKDPKKLEPYERPLEALFHKAKDHFTRL